ncbi:MAG: sigma-70 family RNA polymerase sigma factor, partial [Chloroflexaceae bacterium]
MSQDFPPESDDDPRMRRLLAAYAPALHQHLRERLDGLLSDDLAAQIAPAIRAAARDDRALDADTAEPPLALRRSVSEKLTIFCLRTGLTGPALVLLLEYAPHIKQALKRGKHGQYLSAEDLEDLAQDTIVRAVERGAQYQPELSSLGRWLNVLAHYAMLDLIRDRSVLDAAGRDRIAAEQLQALGDGAPEFDEQMRGRIREAIGKLSPGLALYIQRSFLEGWSDAEIQHALNARPGTLRVWKTRALQKLRAILGSSLGLVLVMMIVTVGPVVAQPLVSALGLGPIAEAPGQTRTATVAPPPFARIAEPPSLATASATATPPSASPTLAPPSVAPARPVPSVTPAESVAAPSATATLAATPTPAATATPLTLPSPLAAPPSSDGSLPPTATPRLDASGCANSAAATRNAVGML